MLQPLQAHAASLLAVQTVDTPRRREPPATLSYNPSQTHAKPTGNHFCNIHRQAERVGTRSMGRSSPTGVIGGVGLV